MNELPVQPLSQEEQQRLMGQMYLLLGKQVKSYHRQLRMGENSSVPVELARELMESIEYTVEQAGGLYASKHVEDVWKQGQELLESKVEKAKAMLELVAATAPVWQTECRWETLSCLRRYLVNYDHIHLAHRGPDDLFYPVLVRVPEVNGIDLCMFYLNVLWAENQIMAGFDDAILEQLWSRLPTDTLNPCEQVVMNGIGKTLLASRSDDLIFSEAERKKLQTILSTKPTGETVRHAAQCLCCQLELSENASTYLCTAAVQMLPRLEVALQHDYLSAIFL